jgi:hypothetical protein
VRKTGVGLRYLNRSRRDESGAGINAGSEVDAESVSELGHMSECPEKMGKMIGEYGSDRKISLAGE